MSFGHRMFTPVLDLSEIKNIGDNASVTSIKTGLVLMLTSVLHPGKQSGVTVTH